MTSSDRLGLIICYQTREIRLDDQRKLLPLERWAYLNEPKGSATALPIGRGGILYAPRALSLKVVDKAAFLELSQQAGDVWLYWMGRRASSTCRTIQQSEGLWDWSVLQKTAFFAAPSADMNDRPINGVAQRYGSPSFNVRIVCRGTGTSIGGMST
ncbi:hypothetical protein [Microvirga soli]|uniref:hypothetical protein n=1 Tax=Microvirga soli TaxID=1854496 RepID=UPI00191DDEEB|nr:hypothetical protein [Microvirga soli]